MIMLCAKQSGPKTTLLLSKKIKMSWETESIRLTWVNYYKKQTNCKEWSYREMRGIIYN